MSKVSRFLALALLLCVSALSFSEDRQRKPWYIGFGVGTFFDAAWITDGRELTWEDFYEHGSSRSPKVCINFKVGATLSPKVLLGLDGTAIREEGSDSYTTIATQISNYFAVLTAFPWQEGFFVRLGGGLSAFTMDIDDEFFGSDSEQYNGLGVLAGVGWAFWLGRRFNLTLNVDHSRQFYSGDGPDSSRFTIVYLGFDWY